MRHRHALVPIVCITLWFWPGFARIGRAEEPDAVAEPKVADRADESQKKPTSQPAMPSIIQKLPNYMGDWASREYMTGDWGGLRTELAEHGILFDLDITQWGQGNAHGGKDTENAFRYSGSADYTLRLDTARMGLWPGGLITLHGETQIGQSINSKVGSLGSPNYQALLPVPGESGLTTLSEFYLTQALSEQVVILAGKIDPTVGDSNEFAHNQRTQFSNTALRINPVLFTSAPYTTMAAGVVLLPTKWLTITNLVMDNDPKGAATVSGFKSALDGRNWMTVAQEYDFTLKPFGQTGHQRFGWFWTSKDFVDFPSDLRLQLPARITSLGRGSRGLVPPGRARRLRIGSAAIRFDGPDKRPDDWGMYYNFDQYLYTKPGDPEQGIGLFGRFGLSTGESNPIQDFYSIGVGGKGLIPHREHDTYGVGYYFMNISDTLQSLMGLQAEQGVEVFYNIQVTPWLRISPDLQVIVDPGAGFGDRDVSIVYGLRGQITF